MERWTDGLLWALAEKLSGRIEGAAAHAKPPPLQAELPLGPGGNVVPFSTTRVKGNSRQTPRTRGAESALDKGIVR